MQQSSCPPYRTCQSCDTTLGVLVDTGICVDCYNKRVRDKSLISDVETVISNGILKIYASIRDGWQKCSRGVIVEIPIENLPIRVEGEKLLVAQLALPKDTSWLNDMTQWQAHGGATKGASADSVGIVVEANPEVTVEDEYAWRD